MSRTPGLRGRRPSPPTPELHLRRFAAEPTPPPPSGDVSGGIVDWGMLDNNKLGNCGAAATMHYFMAKDGTTTVRGATGDGLAGLTDSWYFAYGKAMGEPGAEPDDGVDNATWLKFLFAQGIIDGYARLDVTNAAEIRAAMLNFSGVLVGCSLTDQAEQEFSDEQPWTITSREQPDPKEGHDILLVKYDVGGETFVTWGALQNATVAWESGEVADKDLEAWVLISQEDADRNGVDLPALQAQITAWGGEVIPTLPPVPSPAPQPEPTPAPQPAPSPGPPAPSPVPGPVPVQPPDGPHGFIERIRRIAQQAEMDIEAVADEFVAWIEGQQS